MRLSAIAAAVALSVWGLAPARAATITATQHWDFFPFYSGEFYQPTFDPTLGKLDSVQVTVSGVMIWHDAAIVTQPPGHTTIMPAVIHSGATWYDSFGIHGFGFDVLRQYWILRRQVGVPSGTMNIYETFQQNPASFADGSSVEMEIDGNGGVNPLDCKAPCHFMWTGGDGGTGGYGRVTTTFTYTPTPTKVSEPPTLLLLALAMAALGATRFKRI